MCLLSILFIPSTLHAYLPQKQRWSIIGDFEMDGFFSAGLGWQKFMRGDVTERANDWSFAGPLGELLSETPNESTPARGQDVAEAFVEVLEIDIAREFGERATLRGDIWFGRQNSGSWVRFVGMSVEQAYATVRLSDAHDIEFLVGRFVTLAGFESPESFNNDNIGWSIANRGSIYPTVATGAQLSIGAFDGGTFYLIAANNFSYDTVFKSVDFPSGAITFQYVWGDAPHKEYVVVTPHIGPESDQNRHLTFGGDITAVFWLGDLQIGLQSDFRRDNAIDDPSASYQNTSYTAGMLDLHYDFTDRFYAYARYSFAKQFASGNGVYNLTGAKQMIHEASLGAGYYVADGVKLKFEGRVDTVVPDYSRTQVVPGVAFAITTAF